MERTRRSENWREHLGRRMTNARVLNESQTIYSIQVNMITFSVFNVINSCYQEKFLVHVCACMHSRCHCMLAAGTFSKK